MKTEEDEAFDDLAKRQGDWGGGFQAKRRMAEDKLQEPWNEDEWRRNNWRCQHGWLRGEQCEICNASLAPKPAYPAGPCDCGVAQEREAFKLALDSENPDIQLRAALAIRADLAQPAQEAIYGMNQDDWKDVVTAISKVRDGRGIYLACRPADVFQEWFLHLGTAKLRSKNND